MIDIFIKINNDNMDYDLLIKMGNCGFRCLVF